MQLILDTIDIFAPSKYSSSERMYHLHYFQSPGNDHYSHCASPCLIPVTVLIGRPQRDLQQKSRSLTPSYKQDK